jgi:hypothetical protein
MAAQSSKSPSNGARTSPRRGSIIKRLGPKLGRARRITVPTIRPLPLEDASKLAQQGYQRFLDDGHPKEIAEKFKKDLFDFLVAV